LKIWDFGRIGKKVIGADDHGSNAKKNISGAETLKMSPHMLDSDNRNSSYAQKRVFYWERVLVKARSRTPRQRIPNPGPYF
jgi:hypothetical protein